MVPKGNAFTFYTSGKMNSYFIRWRKGENLETLEKEGRTGG